MKKAIYHNMLFFNIHLFSITSQNINFALYKKNRLNHSSSMNNTVANKIINLTQLIILGPQIPVKQKWHHFLS